MIKQLIVGDTSHELAATRRILECLPEEHLSWKPHDATDQPFREYHVAD